MRIPIPRRVSGTHAVAAAAAGLATLGAAGTASAASSCPARGGRAAADGLGRH